MANNKLNILILIIAPFIYLFPHTFQFIEMGNDFELLYFSYKKYIFEFLRVGHLPLWSPSESLGFSLIFNPFAQYFYPLSWILYGLCYLVGDLSKHTYLLYTIFGISIYNVGQYFWLRKLNFDKKYCLIATLIVCFGLKLTEILRFPNAIHAFAWFPWILYAMTLTLEKKKIIKSSIIIFISILSIFTAGYPYYILYGFILFSFYFLFISIPFIKIKILTNKDTYQYFYKSFLNNIVPALVAFAIALPWFMEIQELMEITRDRNLKDITFSSILNSNILDQLGSWILPPISIAESNYYFGAIITTILIYYFINLIFDKNKKKNEIYFIIFFILFFVFNYQIAIAEESYLFKFMWNKIDFIQNFRGFSRINILLLPLFAILISFALKNLNEHKMNKNILLVLSFLIFLIICSQIYLLEVVSAKSSYWVTWQEKRLLHASEKINFLSVLFNSYNNYIYTFFFIVSFLMLLIIKIKNIKKYILSIILILVVGELFIMSNIQWAIPYKYYDDNGYNKLSKNPLEDLKKAFVSSRVLTEVKGNTYYRNFKKFNINYFDQFGVDSHTKFFDKYFNRDGSLKNEINKTELEKVYFLWSLNNYSSKIFFSKSIYHNSISALVDDIKLSESQENIKINFNIDSYNGDKIFINVDSSSDGYIIFVDNWSPGWKVFVNNEEKKIIKALNTYKSVKIIKGSSNIIFEYKPWQ